jgi:hypothetical protein
MEIVERITQFCKGLRYRQRNKTPQAKVLQKHWVELLGSLKLVDMVDDLIQEDVLLPKEWETIKDKRPGVQEQNVQFLALLEKKDFQTFARFVCVLKRFQLDVYRIIEAETEALLPG